MQEVHPRLRAIYEKFKPLGLEILAVSFDNSKEKWLQAIEEDKLPWLHVSDLRYWSSAPRDLYQITYVPQYIIVDSAGIIQKRRLTEIEMEQYLGNAKVTQEGAGQGVTLLWQGAILE